MNMKLKEIVDHIKENIQEDKIDINDLLIGDFHSSNTKAIFANEFIDKIKENGMKIKGSAKEMRGVGKTVGLALLYGGSEFTVSQKTGLSKDESKSIVEKFYSSLSKLKQVHKYQKHLAETQEIAKNIFGAIRYLPGVKKRPWSEINAMEPDEKKKHFGKVSKFMRLSLNFPIQSSSAFQVLMIIIATNTFIEENRLNRTMGNLKVNYKPYTRVVGININNFDPLLEERLDNLPDGNVIFIVTDGDRVVMQMDKPKQITTKFIRDNKLEIIY
jgi:hypothetical protein